MGCASGTCRYLLFLFNFLFCLCGIALIAVGSVTVHNQGGTFTTLIEGDVSTLAIIIIVVGIITFVIAFCGCCGAIRENHCLLITFSILLLTLFVGQLVISIYAFVNRDKFEVESQNVVDGIFNKGDTDEIYAFEAAFQCCGTNGFPTNPGCCKNYLEEKNCDLSNKEEIWQTGCKEAFKNFWHSSYIIVGGVCIGIAFIEICGAIIGFAIANSIRHKERRNY